MTFEQCDAVESATLGPDRRVRTLTQLLTCCMNLGLSFTFVNVMSLLNGCFEN